MEVPVPWTEETKVDKRQRFVMRLEEDVSMAQACRDFGITRKTGYKWKKRFEEEGVDGLEDRSRAPDTIPHKTDPAVEQKICMVREDEPQFGPKKIRARLEHEFPGGDWPAASTIGAILKRRGYIDASCPPDSPEAPPRDEPLEEADRPNKIWSIDFKGQFELGNGQMCFPLTITDNYSRMVVGCKALPSTSGQPVYKYLQDVFERWGLPERVRSDNGAPFASAAPHGLSWVSAWWTALGIEHERIDPGCPQQNPRHERFHLTLKRWCARPAAETMAAQQRVFERFIEKFNQRRPHESLDQSVPASAHSTCDAGNFSDADTTLDYPVCDFSRKVSSNGTIKVGGQVIQVSEALRGFDVGLKEVLPDLWVVVFADKPVGYLESGDTTITRIDKHGYPKQLRF
jgi:transposase InsO family protein/transposase-like protein